MEIALRQASSEDRALLKEWVNHPESALARLDAKTLARHAPAKPPARALPRSLSLIVREGLPVGQVSLEEHDGSFLLDIFVDPAERRKGIARSALLSLIKEHGRDHSDATYLARVAIKNDSGRGFFSMLGFTFVDQDASHITYRRLSTEIDSRALRSLFGQPADKA